MGLSSALKNNVIQRQADPYGDESFGDDTKRDAQLILLTPRLGTDLKAGPSLAIDTQESIGNEQAVSLNCTNKLVCRLNVQNGFNETVGNIIQKIEDEDGVNQDADIPENLFEERIIEENSSNGVMCEEELLAEQKPKMKKKVL